MTGETEGAARLEYVDERTPRFVETMRALVVGGIFGGAVLIGLGSRVAMLALRLTSPHDVRGVKSDDGFVIGRVTLAGTYNLMLLGAVFGIIGAGAYLMVTRWLIGPVWLRRLTTALAAGAVVGSMLIHADGIDFSRLGPKWFAIGLFIALPAMFGWLIGSIVDSIRRPDSWTSVGRTRWVLPLVLVACFPLTVVVLVFAAPIVAVWLIVSDLQPVQRLRRSAPHALVVRAVWLGVAILGLVAVINDTRAVVAGR
ncbi:MAG TPA: hypothetical protein VFE86_17915 [Ilumatobacteraceae bacterium]|nr:hypothetical protein [Ilumatobacteraceae bacterium]